ncbi:MAG: hypothetical protein ACREHD_11465 [Pirellulales bacterium]
MMYERARLKPTDVYWLTVVPLSALNFLFPLLAAKSEAVWLVACFGGLLIGEWNWLAVWAVLGPTAWKIRLLEVLGGMLSLCAGLLAAASVHDSIAPRDLATTACLLPLAFIATQAPLWLLRFLFGWRIRAKHDSAGPASDDARRFDLRHIFAATAVVAVCLAAARAAGTTDWTLPGMLVGLPLVSVVTAVPCILTGMVIADAAKANLCIAAYVFVLAGIVPAYNLLVAHGPFWEIFVPMFGFICGMSIVVHAGLRLMHAEGHRMSAPRTPRRGLETALEEG